MVLPMIAGVGALSVFYIGASLLVALYFNYFYVPIDVAAALQASARALAIVAVPVTVAVLLVVTITALRPIWSAHDAMRKHQHEDETTYTDSAKRLTGEITAGLAAHNLDQARAAKEELELVEAVYVPAEDYPTWPLQGLHFVQFVGSQVISLLGAVGSAVVHAHLPHL